MTKKMEHCIRLAALVVALLLTASGPAAAQEWIEYVSARDGFKANFPGQPQVTEGTWTSQYGYELPMRVYSAETVDAHYSTTVVDYGGIEQMGLERLEDCPPGGAYCRAGEMYGPYYAFHDERGAIVYATKKLLQRDARLEDLIWEWQDYVEGHMMQLTNNDDDSRTAAFIAMREHKLYIMEGTVANNRPPPLLFQQSLGWVDEDGNPVRYTVIYSNRFHAMGVYPVPPLTGRGQGAAADTRGGAEAGANAPVAGGK